MTACLQCGKEFDTPASRLAVISGSIMGDECTDSYLWCTDCGVYTVESYYEPFLGEDEVSYRGPVSKENGDGFVALIHQCSCPWDKKCRCAAHREYFGDSLD